MINLSDSSVVMPYISELKKTQGDYFSNYFLTPLEAQIPLLHSEKSLIFLQPEYDFYRLYFATIDINDFKNLLKQVPENLDVCIEVVTNSNIPEQLLKTLCEKFKLTETYQKLYKKLDIVANTEYCPDMGAFTPECIFEHVWQDFNKYYDHLPSLEKIETFLNNGKLISIENEQGDLCGYILFEIKGKQAYLNYIANYGGKKTLLLLWERFYNVLSHYNVKSIYLWYNINNKKASRMYQIENFEDAHLKNYIFLRK